MMNRPRPEDYCPWSDLLQRECAHCLGHREDGDNNEYDAVGRVAEREGVTWAVVEARIPRNGGEGPEEE